MTDATESTFDMAAVIAADTLGLNRLAALLGEAAALANNLTEGRHHPLVRTYAREHRNRIEISRQAALNMAEKINGRPTAAQLASAAEIARERLEAGWHFRWNPPAAPEHEMSIRTWTKLISAKADGSYRVDHLADDPNNQHLGGGTFADLAQKMVAGEIEWRGPDPEDDPLEEPTPEWIQEQRAIEASEPAPDPAIYLEDDDQEPELTDAEWAEMAIYSALQGDENALAEFLGAETFCTRGIAGDGLVLRTAAGAEIYLTITTR